MTEPTVIDFETEAIEPYPNFPPKPVGVAIYKPPAPPEYLCWGHPSGNNCTFEEARRRLAAVWNGDLLFHNGRFDTEVARVHMGLPYPKDVLTVHDTMFLLYLYDAQAPSLSLKPSAHRILGMPPEEQDAVREWLAAKGFGGKDWGAHISKAPGELVGPYAIGDVVRTYRLFEPLMSYVNRTSMLQAYRREQRIAPILSANEREGIRVDLPRLQQDLETWEKMYDRITTALLQKIGDCNPDSSGELAAALLRSGYARETDFARTPTGRLSTSKDSVARAVKDPALVQLLGYRGHLKTLLTTFMRPWAAIASATGGRLHPQFNQVKGDEYGTRTGRLSSSNPNFQNIPNEFPDEPPEGFPPLPFMRQYVLPDEGHVLVPSDFNGQEMRIAAHFAEGRAADIYRNNPRADFHQVVSEILKEEAGIELPRKQVKIIGFTMLYGGGLGVLAERLKVNREVASRIKAHYFAALPGLKELMDDVMDRGRAGAPVKTWGGRLIYCEPPKMVNGRMWTFEYKLLNHLIQGSAADQTKEAIATAGYKTKHRRFLATVHDENDYSVDPDHLKEQVQEIKSSMEDQPGWDVPFKAEVEVGPNWWDLEPFEG